MFRNPSVEQLSLCKKDALIKVATHYEIPGVKRCMLKSDILRQIVDFLIEEEVLPPDAADNARKTPPSSPSPVDVQMKVSDNEVRTIRAGTRDGESRIGERETCCKQT